MVYITDYNGGLSQNWRHFSGEFISDRENRKLTLKNFVSRETRQRVTACRVLLQKSFSLRISSVNVTKSKDSCGFGHIY